MPLEDGRHGLGGRISVHPRRLGGDILPNGALIRPSRAGRSHGCRNLRHACGAAAGIHHMRRGTELGGVHVPPTRLHAGHRDEGGLFRGKQDGQVEYAVLFGADKFLSVQQEYGLVAVVLKTQFRNRASIHFSDSGEAPPHGLVSQ